MATKLPRDFKDFLKLLDKHGVEYLLIGGYAVAYYGYPHSTADMDVWVADPPLQRGTDHPYIARIRVFHT